MDEEAERKEAGFVVSADDVISEALLSDRTPPHSVRAQKFREFYLSDPGYRASDAADRQTNDGDLTSLVKPGPDSRR